MLFDLYGEKCEILTGLPNAKRNIPEAAGGTGILFQNADQAMEDIDKLMLDIGEDDNNKTLVSAAFAGNKAVVRKEKHLYMININELNWDKQEQESQKNAESEE